MGEDQAAEAPTVEDIVASIRVNPADMVEVDPAEAEDIDTTDAPA